MSRQQDSNRWHFASAGLELVGKMLVLMGIGYAIDLWLETKPIGTVIGAILGIVGGLVKLVWDSMHAFPASKPRRDDHQDRK